MKQLSNQTKAQGQLFFLMYVCPWVCLMSVLQEMFMCFPGLSWYWSADPFLYFYTQNFFQLLKGMGMA